jgi:hypothetical protein
MSLTVFRPEDGPRLLSLGPSAVLFKDGQLGARLSITLNQEEVHALKIVATNQGKMLRPNVIALGTVFIRGHIELRL